MAILSKAAIKVLIVSFLFICTILYTFKKKVEIVGSYFKKFSILAFEKLDEN